MTEPTTPDTAPLPWCTIADVAAVTGATVTQGTIDLARDAIEFATGAIESVNRVYLSRRDYYWLRQAVAYQAVWLSAQPDYLVRDDVTEVSQDGATVKGGADRIRLAPLARSACKQLSWKGTRVAAPRPPDVRRTDYEGNLLAGNTSPLPQYIGGDPFNEGADETEAWSGLNV